MNYYADAKICAHSCALFDLAGPNLTALELAEQNGLADHAIEVLRKAAATGFGGKDLRADASFESLRGRADFQLLVFDFAFPIDPFAR